MILDFILLLLSLAVCIIVGAVCFYLMSKNISESLSFKIAEDANGQNLVEDIISMIFTIIGGAFGIGCFVALLIFIRS